MNSLEDFSVVEATLLSTEEYERYAHIIPLVKGVWWLRSPSPNSEAAACVSYSGAVYGYGYYVYRTNFGVRPAFRINLPDSYLFNAGDKIYVHGLECTVLNTNADKNEFYVLSDTVITRRRFDKESNDWETSELKAYLDQRFVQQKKIVTLDEYKLALIDEFAEQLHKKAHVTASIEDFISLLEDSTKELKSKLYCDLQQEQEEETEL